MKDIFGIPMNGILVVLVVAMAIFLISVGWVAWRRPVIFKLGTRNIPRRKTQTLLIVVGLMLSTLIMTAALGTGDSVNGSISSDVYINLGHIDELIVASQQQDATFDLSSSEPLAAGSLPLVERAAASDENIAGILPLLEARVSAVNDATQLAEPDTVLVGIDPTRFAQFGGLTSTSGKSIDPGTLAPNDVVLSQKLANSLDAKTGDRITVFVDNAPHQLNVVAIAQNTYLSGTRRSVNTFLEYSGMAMSLAGAQAVTNQPDTITAIAVANTGGTHGGLKRTDEVTSNLRQSISGHDLGITTIKQDRVDQATRMSSSFSTIFMLLGMFSVVAGVLLIVLIFTMLASERRAEMGMERAIGTHRRQLIQQFAAEGSGYALGAGLVGAALGVVATLGIVQAMKPIYGQYATVAPHITLRSVAVGYALGMVITFLAVVASSWKISRLNIVAAVRDSPEYSSPQRKKSTLVWASLLLIGGALLALMGTGGNSAPAFSIGMSLIPFGIALFLRFFGVPSRPIFTVLGIFLVAFWLLPQGTFNRLFGDFSFGVEMFFLSGIFMVIGATIIVVQNSDLLLKSISMIGSLFRSKLPAVRTGVAYPSAAPGRTGLTIAMFSLILFSLVMMATLQENFKASASGNQANAGWDVRADTLVANPPTSLESTLQSKGVDTSEFTSVGMVTNPSDFASAVRVAGQDTWKIWPVKGADQSFLDHSQLEFSQRAEGYATDANVIRALETQPDVAVIDAFALPQDGDVGSNADYLQLIGLKSSDKTFKPLTVELAGATGGSVHTLKIIGIIDSKIGSLRGIYMSQQTLDSIYPSTVVTSYHIALKDPANAGVAAKQIESTLLQNGFQATSIRDQLKDAQREESGFLYIIEGFMGLGLIIGMAAVGVITFRSVVERRQQIGVMRALGFRREMVSFSFMVETAFVVGIGILTGSVLGIELTRKLVHDPNQGFSADVAFVIPWSIIIPIMLLAAWVALLMTWIPARQASRIAPAEALRYE